MYVTKCIRTTQDTHDAAAGGQDLIWGDLGRRVEREVNLHTFGSRGGGRDADRMAGEELQRTRSRGG